MTKFLIEVSHSEDILACAKVIKVFLGSGSHLLSHADWGCEDGIHKCWMIAEVDSKEDALRIVPPAFRKDAKIIQLCKFSMEEIDQIISHHKGSP